MALISDDGVQHAVRRVVLDVVRAIARPKVLSALGFGVFCALVVAASIGGLLRPERNWDMVPYIAAALERDGASAAEIHAAAYAASLDGADAWQAYDLTAGNPYKRALYENADAFVSQLPMYRVKTAYVAAIAFLDRWMAPVTATAVIAALSTFVVGLTALVWAWRENAAQGLLLVAPAMAILGYANLALTAWPDMMMAAFALPGLYLSVKGRAWAAVPFFVLMFLTRPDGIFLTFALLLAALAFRRDWLPHLAAFALCAAIYPLITAAADHPGWWPHFVFSTVAIQVDMTGFDPAFSVSTYLTGVVRGVGAALRNDVWPMAAVLIGLFWAIAALAGRGGDRRQVMVMTALFMAIAGKFVVFPLPNDRVYFAFMVALVMVLVTIVKPDLSFDGRWPRRAPAER